MVSFDGQGSGRLSLIWKSCVWRNRRIADSRWCHAARRADSAGAPGAGIAFGDSPPPYSRALRISFAYGQTVFGFELKGSEAVAGGADIGQDTIANRVLSASMRKARVTGAPKPGRKRIGQRPLPPLTAGSNESPADILI